MRRAAPIFALLAALTVPAGATSPCTTETLNVQGAPVKIGYCVTGAARPAGGQEIIVPVVATYSASARSSSQARELHFLAEPSVSRVLEAFDLSQLGLSGTLHLTLAYSQGLVRVEGALLTPGAITIK
jgi:hypothetical protein